MAQYIISYDLHHDRDYRRLWDKLRSGGAVRLLESVWLANSNASAAQVYDDLRTTVDGDDALVVIELKPGSGWKVSITSQPAGIAWLRANIAN